MRIRPAISTLASLICASLVCASLLCASPGRAQSPGGAADAARARLQKSFESACRQFDSEREPAALEKCNLAWFHANERDVWRLNLNPHAKPSTSSPSS